MANQYVNKVEYGNDTLIDLTEDSVTPNTLLPNTTAHNRSGAPISGSASASVLPAVDTDNILGGGAGASTNTQAMLDGLADGYGAIRTDLSDYHVTPSKNLFDYVAYKNDYSSNLHTDFIPDEYGNVAKIRINGTASSGQGISFSFRNYPGALKLSAGSKYVYSIGTLPSNAKLDAGYTNPSTGNYVSVASTAANYVEITAPSESAGMPWTFSLTFTDSISYTNVDIYPMLCTKADWDADNTYEPYYPAMRDGMFPRSEQAILGAKNLAGVNDITWLNLGSATHTKNGTGLDIQTAAASTSGVYSDNPSAVQSLIDKYGSLTVSFIYKSDIACAGSIGANADAGRFITLPTNWTKYEFTFTPSMTSPHLQFYNKDNTKTPKISVRDIMFRLPSDPDDIFAPRASTNAELTYAKNCTISYGNGISQTIAAQVPIFKVGSIAILNVDITGVVANQSTWVTIGSIPVGFRPIQLTRLRCMKNASTHIIDAYYDGGNIAIRDNSGAIASGDALHLLGVYYSL